MVSNSGSSSKRSRSAASAPVGSSSSQDGSSGSAGEDPLSRRADAGKAVRVDLVLQTPDTQPPLRGWLDRHMRRIARLAQAPGGRITLLITDDERMSQLHQQYRGEAGTTDVLTFDLRDEAEGSLEGDVVICLDEARRQARQRGHDVRMEVLLYAVHGLLHLLGEDDQTPAEARRMHQREDALLAQAGLEPVYAGR